MHCLSCGTFLPFQYIVLVPRAPGKEGFEVVGKGQEEKKLEEMETTTTAESTTATETTTTSTGQDGTTQAEEKGDNKKEGEKPKGKRRL